MLDILDRSAEAFVFPMLDNGYVYPAATRLSAYSGEGAGGGADANGWALVFEVLGYSPRSGVPDLCVTTIGEGFRETEQASDFVSEQAFAAFRQANANWRQDFIHPFDDDDWIDREAMEVMRSDAIAIGIRGDAAAAPSVETLERIDALGAIGEPAHLANVLRALADNHREKLLATEAERRARIPDGWRELLVLDDWRHPDVVREECAPGTSAVMRSLAEVVVHGDPSRLVREEPNTHWSNWPEGGSL